MSAACEQHRPGPGARNAARLGGRVPSVDAARLQLRGPRIYDFAAYAAILCSERAGSVGGPFTRAEAWSLFSQFTAQWMLHGHGLWTVDTQGEPAAGFVLLGFQYGDPEPELGVMLSGGAEGNGYACEACAAARGFAFETLGWDNVVSYVSKTNTRGIRLMERLGATRDTETERALGGEAFVWRHDAAAQAPEQTAGAV